MGMSVMSDVTLVPQKSDIWWVFLLQGFAGIIIGLMLSLLSRARHLWR